MLSRHPAPPALIQTALSRQQLGSERVRVAAFTWLLGFLMGAVILLRLVPGLVGESVRHQLSPAFGPIALVVGIFLAYEFSVGRWLDRLWQADRLPPSWFAWLNTLVEVSLPTVAILVSARFMGGLPVVEGVMPFVYFLLLGLTALSLNFRLCCFAGLVASTGFLLASLFLLQRLENAIPPGTEPALLASLRSPHQYVLKGAFLLTGGLIAGFIASQLKRQLRSGLQTMQQLDQTVSLFGRHVSPEVAAHLLEQPIEAGGQERTVCVMFLDIRDFSRYSAGRPPSEVMHYLNALFGAMIPLVHAHRGIINKFLGDGFMAVFGAPLDDPERCRNAVAAARSILLKVEEMNDARLIPPTRIGIGLHLGVAVTGNVGGDDRLEYTVIGDVVNLASRIEQVTKVFHAHLLISGEVAETLDGACGGDLGLVELKGHDQPLRLFKLA